MTRPDALERSAIRAGLSEVDRARDLCAAIRQRLQVAAAASDHLKAPQFLLDSIDALERNIDMLRSVALVEIAARTKPAPIWKLYPQHYEEIERDGRRLVVMVPGCGSYDPDYFEEVPAP